MGIIGCRQAAVMPPSRKIVCPVRKPAWWEEMKDCLGDLFRISCTPQRDGAQERCCVFLASAGDAVEHAGLNWPGPTALTRTPRGAPSRAADLVRPMIACLLATQRDASGNPLAP